VAVGLIIGEEGSPAAQGGQAWSSLCKEH